MGSEVKDAQKYTSTPEIPITYTDMQNAWAAPLFRPARGLARSRGRFRVQRGSPNADPCTVLCASVCDARGLQARGVCERAREVCEHARGSVSMSGVCEHARKVCEHARKVCEHGPRAYAVSMRT